MKKFHKRAAVFLTAATLAGLPAGAFFYSSPGSLTVWADNVEVESSEESSPEDVDFSDGSEAEILADPVEQAQEDAGNDVIRMGLPKIAAVVIVALSYKWKHNTLVSIAVGTAGYMILLRLAAIL